MTWPVIVLALVTTGLHLALHAGYGWFRDEMYYVACARRLDWGYVDLPPFTPLLLRLALAVTGPSLVVMRGMAAIAAGLSVLLAGAIAATLGGGRRAQVVAAIAVMLTPILVGVFAIFSPNAFDVVLWALACLVLARLLASRDPREWLLLGAVLGVAILNKHTAAILVLAIGAGLVATPARRMLATPWPWAGAAVAMVVAAPHVAWQALHGWPTLEFTATARAEKMIAAGPIAFLAEQLIVLDPLAVPVWAGGLVWLLARPAARPWRALGAAALGTLVITAASGGKAYYLAGIHPAVFAAGGVWLEGATAGRPRRGSAAVAAIVVGGLLIAPLAKPVLSEQRTLRWMQAAGTPQSTGTGERHAAAAPLPQTFADMHGWPELVQAVATVYHALPAEERGRACLVTGNYGEAAAIDLFGPALGLPPAISGHNSYHLWGRRGCDFSVAVVVGVPRDALDGAFARVESTTTTDCRWCMPHEARLPIWVVREPRAAPDALWAMARRYR